MNLSKRVTGTVLLVVLTASAVLTGTTASAATGPKATYMLLADGSMHRNEPPPASGFYVLGKVSRGRFLPSGEVLGSGMLAFDGQAGWIELADGAFYADDSGRTPQAPYVRGRKGEDGAFRPDEQRVVY
jgi:hypothetical protein